MGGSGCLPGFRSESRIACCAYAQEEQSADLTVAYGRKSLEETATRPTLPEFSLESPLFRAILLRRLRLPVPLTSARGRCRAHLDPCGDHLLAARPRSGILRARGGPFERAAARVCREAGAAVALNVPVRDLNEVIANGLLLWGGAQLASITRLASRGWEGESARMSLRGGNSPSTLAVPVRGKDSKQAAKERAAAKETRGQCRPIWRLRVKVGAQTAPRTLPASGEKRWRPRHSNASQSQEPGL